jgi:hypothetical protein
MSVPCFSQPGGGLGHLDPLAPSLVGEEMLGFNNEAQGWLPCKIVEESPHEELWTVDLWDNSQEDSTKERGGGASPL